MTPSTRPADPARPLHTLRRRLLAAPIGVKIIGVGAVVAALFGVVTERQLDAHMAPIFSRHLERLALTIARSLANRIERPLIVGDLVGVRSTLLDVVADQDEVRYAFVLDADDKPVAHTFAGGLPGELLALGASPGRSGTVTALKTATGYVFDASVPVLGGRAGTLRIGLSDRGITREMDSTMSPVRATLALCVLVGGAFALLLTAGIVRPIHRLMAATHALAAGESKTRAPVFAEDEIGQLAQSFNVMAETLDRQHAQALEQQKARQELMSRIVFAQEDERERIARDLHDELGQSLSALMMVVHQNPRDDAGREVIEGRIRALIDQVRGIAWSLRPSILDDYGLDRAIERHAAEVAAEANLQIEFQTSSPGGKWERLDDSVETVLYRVAQEALANVVRHARAETVSVLLLRTPAQVTLLVEDDGAGFDLDATQAGAPRARLGLLGMEERMALIGGELRIESEVGRGTALRARVTLSGRGT